jgi:poly(3-hydroxybutyrate) depolymerase
VSHACFNVGMLPVVMAVAMLAQTAPAQTADLPRGRVIDRIQCADDSSQSYALYVPSAYASDREWPVIFAFDPGGRGPNPVEHYRAAAEKYGYIVAGSNNSRNGDWKVSMAAVSAITRDVSARFNLSAKREYVAGMSGGARVALGVALSSPQVAGVFASSAGYPDGRSRSELQFPVFETAGSEDFNRLEMREMDRALKSPHRLAIFEGGHVWLPSAVAMQAVEWMEIQAMKSGRKPKDQAEIDAIFAARVAAADTTHGDAASLAAASGIAEDFAGLEDVSRFAARAAQLRSAPAVRDELKQEGDLDHQEEQWGQMVRGEETLLGDPAQRESALKQLRERWKKLSGMATAADDTPNRRMARRILGGLSMGVTVQDPDYLAIVREYRPARQTDGAAR